MKVPWGRVGIALAVAALGCAQLFFNIIRGNREHFPPALSFHVWVVLWVLVLPAVLLGLADALVARTAGEGSRGQRLWRGFLYALTAVLLLRQAQASHAAFFLPPWSVLPAYGLAAAGVFLFAFRRPAGADRYVAVLGLLAPLLVAQYALGVRRPAPVPEVREEAPKPGPPVVLLVFDEWGLDSLLKDGAIDRVRFPRVAAVADEGAWFPDAVANHSETDRAMPAMFTGRRMPEPGAPSVFSFLRESHRVTAHIAWPILRHILRELAAGPGDRYLSRTDAEAFRLGPLDVLRFMRTVLFESAFYAEGWTATTGMRLPPPDLWDVWSEADVLGSEVASVLGLLETEPRRGRLLYWHCSLPHMPFRVDAEGRRHRRPHEHFLGPHPHAGEVYANYLEAARGVDRLVGLVVDRLKARGIYEETILILTSDHGVRTHGALDIERTIRIPMIVRGPSIRPGVRDADYQQIDFAPTLLDLLGAAAPPGTFEGRSAFSGSREPREARYDVKKDELRRARPGEPWRRP